MASVVERVISVFSSVAGTLTVDFDAAGLPGGTAGDRYIYRQGETDLTENTTLAFSNDISGYRFLVLIQNTSGVPQNWIVPSGRFISGQSSLTNAIGNGEFWEFSAVRFGAVWNYALTEATLIT